MNYFYLFSITVMIIFLTSFFINDHKKIQLKDLSRQLYQAKQKLYQHQLSLEKKEKLKEKAQFISLLPCSPFQMESLKKMISSKSDQLDLIKAEIKELTPAYEAKIKKKKRSSSSDSSSDFSTDWISYNSNSDSMTSAMDSIF